MSAWIVSYETINKIMTYLIDNNNGNFEGYHVRRLFDKLRIFGSENIDNIGINLLKMNIDAVNQRYCDKNDYAYAKKYKFERTLRTEIEVLKALQCFIYQCSEGKVPNRKLYKSLDEFEKSLAFHIINKMPEYNKAEWG